MLRLLFVFSMVAIGVVAALRSRFGALSFYTWYALFRPQEWVWGGLAEYRLSTVLGLLLVVPCVVTGLWPVFLHPISIWALGFLGTCFIAQAGAIDPATGWYWIDFMVKLVLVSLLAIRLLSTERRVLIFLGVVDASFGFHSVNAGIGSLLSGGARYFGGFGGAFADNNTYAVGCVMIVPLLIAFAQNAPWRWSRWATALAIPLTIVTIISTFSRGGLLALTSAILVWLFLQKRRLPLFAAALALSPLLLFVRLPAGYTDRISTIRTYEEVGDDSAIGRLHFWRVALDMAADRPLGVGLWNFESAYDQYDFSNGEYGTRRAVHNSHLQVLTETGWLGAVCWGGLFATAFVLMFRVRRRALDMERHLQKVTYTVATALLASMTGFLVGGTFVSMAYNDLTWITFALVASMDRLSREWVGAPQKADNGITGSPSFDGIGAHAPAQ